MKTEQLKIDGWYRQHKSALIIDGNGQVEEDRVIKKGEVLEFKKPLTDKQKYKMNQTKDIKEFIASNEGNFIHSLYKYCYPYLVDLQNLDNGSKNNIHIIRFVVLCTYLSKDGYIRYDSRKITKSRLIRIWNLKDSKQSKKTYEKLKEINYIYEDEEGYIMVDNSIMTNGKIEGFKKLRKVENDLTYTRLFSKNIQDMYYSCEEKDRKQLANLFKLLPFVNFKYNVFCMNPQEIDKKKLILCNWKDLARLCGYEESNSARLKKDLMKLRIYDSLTIGMFTTANGNAICINPKIYYSDSDISEVKYLYSLFEMCDKKNKIN